MFDLSGILSGVGSAYEAYLENKTATDLADAQRDTARATSAWTKYLPILVIGVVIVAVIAFVLPRK